MLGAAFKPDSDDVRDSPALEVVSRLMSAGAHVTVTDPEALDNAAKRVPGLVGEPHTEQALAGAELVLLLTEWREYRGLDPVRVRNLVAAPRMIDGRNVLDPGVWRDAGWAIRSLGRGAGPANGTSVADGPAARPDLPIPA